MVGSMRAGVAVFAVAFGIAPGLADAPPQERRAESEYLTVARQVAAQFKAVERRETAGISWPSSAKVTVSRTGIESGAAGIGWFHLELYKATRDSEYLVTAERAAAFVNSRYRANQFDGPDWLAGAAGGGAFFLALYDETRNQTFLRNAVYAADWLVKTSIVSGNGRHWRHNATIQKIYTGAYHGAAGIGLFLLDVHERTGDTRYLTTARDAARWMQRYTLPLGPGAIGWKRLTTDTYGYNHFCGGATGIMPFLLRLGQVTGENTYFELFRATARGLLARARKSAEGISWSYSTDDTGSAPIVFCHGSSSAAVALLTAYVESSDAEFLDASRGASRWTMSRAKRDIENAKYWPHIDKWGQFESGYQTGTASVGHALLALHRVDPNPEYLANARAAAEYLMTIADRPGEGRIRWINYTNPDRPDWPHDYNHGWYSGAAGIGLFFLELDAALRVTPSQPGGLR